VLLLLLPLWLLLARSPAAAAALGRGSSSLEDDVVTCEAATSNGDNSYCQDAPADENVTTRRAAHQLQQQPQHTPPKLYLYHNAVNNRNENNNVTVVQEYLVVRRDDDADDTNSTRSMAQVLGIPRHDGSATTTTYYSMVLFYLPYCDGCKKLQAAYVDLSQRVQDLMRDIVAQNSTSFHVFHQSLAVSCHTQAHRALCDAQDIAQYPTFRLYRHSQDGDGQPHEKTTTLSHPRDLHPFTVLELWGVPRRLSEDHDSSKQEKTLSSSSSLQLMSTLAHWLGDDLYERHKDTAANPRDPPLPLPLAEKLMWFLYTLDQAVVVRTREGAASNALRGMLRELLTSAYYILRHQGWLTAILDEHLELAGILPKSKKEKDDVVVARETGMWDWLLTLQQGVAAWNAAAVLPSTQITNLVEIIQDLLREADQTTARVWCGGIMQQHENNANDENHNNYNADDADCRHLFLQPLPRQQRGVVDPDQSVALWLAELRWQWQQRQKQLRIFTTRIDEAATTMDEEGVDWPSREQCPRCWTASTKETANTNRSPNHYNKPSWNEEAVYAYIRLEYGPSSWLTMSKREQEELHERVFGRRDSNDGSLNDNDDDDGHDEL